MNSSSGDLVRGHSICIPSGNTALAVRVLADSLRDNSEARRSIESVGLVQPGLQLIDATAVTFNEDSYEELVLWARFFTMISAAGAATVGSDPVLGI